MPLETETDGWGSRLTVLAACGVALAVSRSVWTDPWMIGASVAAVLLGAIAGYLPRRARLGGLVAIVAMAVLVLAGWRAIEHFGRKLHPIFVVPALFMIGKTLLEMIRERNSRAQPK